MKTFYFTRIVILFFFAFGTGLYGQAFVDISATGDNTGISWENAYTDLSDALAATNHNEIWIASGTYHPGSGNPDSSSTFFVRSPVLRIYGGFNGTEKNIFERGSTSVTILSGDILNDDELDVFDDNKNDNVQHVMVIDSLHSSTVIIDRIIFRGGHTSDIDGQDDFLGQGGGIFSYSTAFLSDCHFSGNFARAGASVYISSASGGGNTSTFSNCTFTHNRSSNQSAGIFLDAISGVTVTACQFMNNQTRRGVLYPFKCSNLRVQTCTFSNNTDIDEAGLGAVFFNWNSTDVILETCSFSNNVSGSGGACFYDGTLLENSNVEDMILKNCVFLNNRALDARGGGLYCYNASMTVDSCHFEANRGPWGGQIAFVGNDRDLWIRKSLFLDGIAGERGGAIYMIGDSATVQVDHSTFDSNFAEFRGGATAQTGGIKVNYNHCQFNANEAGDFGGAIFGRAYTVHTEPSKLDVHNSTFYSNKASMRGGGICIVAVDVDISSTVLANNSVPSNGVAGGAIYNNSNTNLITDFNIIHSTLADNSAPIGSGIAQYTDGGNAQTNLTIQNCILANVGENYGIESGTPSVTSNGGNLSTDNSMTALLDHLMDQNKVTNIFFLDPTNLDYHLTMNSPAIDAGNDTPNIPQEDIEGQPRVNLPDAGAYEFGSFINVYNTESDHAALSILPNPIVKDFAYELTTAWTGQVSLSIYTSHGQLIQSWSKEKTNALLQESFTLEALARGNYYLVAQFGSTIASQGFLKL